PLLDPFVNPAKGHHLRSSELFVAPTIYSISQNAGAARTLPAALRFGSGRWFGATAVAVQQMESPHPDFCCVVPLHGVYTDPNQLNQRAHTNAYGFAMIGTRIPGTMLSIGASASWAQLHSQDGVDQLYGLAQLINQHGYVGDFRLGLTGELGGGRTFEALVL